MAASSKLAYIRAGYKKVWGQLAESAVSVEAAQANELVVGERGLEFPYFNLRTGEQTGFHRTRLFHSAGAKYIQPPGSGCQLYIPKNNYNMEKLRLRETRVIVCEGEKKAIAIADIFDREWAAVALGGVNSFWSGRRIDRETTPIYTVFEQAGLPWLHERAMYVCFDSDKLTNIRVREAEGVLLRTLRERGCEVYSVDVPVASDGRKQGADDWIAAEGTGPLIDAVFMARPKVIAGVVRPLNQPTLVNLDRPPRPAEFLVYPSIQTGANIWFGLPETMKSLTRNQCLVDLLRGKTTIFGGESPWEVRWNDEHMKVLIVCSEEPVEEFASGFWRCAKGNGLSDQVVREMAAKLVFYSAPEYDLRLDRLSDAWDAAGRPRLVFADHLLGLMPRRNFAGSEVNAIADPQVITDTLLQIRMLFVKEQTAFVCIAHTSKANDGVFGSVNWEASSDTITKFHRVEQDDPNHPRIVLQPWKRRHSAHEPSFGLTVEFSSASGGLYTVGYDGPQDPPRKTIKPGTKSEHTDTDQEDSDETLIYNYIRVRPGVTLRQMVAERGEAFRGIGVDKVKTITRKLRTSGLLFTTRPTNQTTYWFTTAEPEDTPVWDTDNDEEGSEAPE